MNTACVHDDARAHKAPHSPSLQTIRQWLKLKRCPRDSSPVTVTSAKKVNCWVDTLVRLVRGGIQELVRAAKYQVQYNNNNIKYSNGIPIRAAGFLLNDNLISSNLSPPDTR